MNANDSHDDADSFLAYLRDQSILDQASVGRVRGAIAASRQPVDVVLLELGLLHENRLADQQAAFLGLERVRAEEFPDEFEPGSDLPADFLRRMELIPLAATADAVIVATARPLRSDAARALQYYLGRRVAVKVATQSEVNLYFKRALDSNGLADADQRVDADSSIEEDVERLKDFAREAPVIRLVSRLIAAAVERSASDIHIEPQEDRVRVRLRIDGVLVDSDDFPKQVQAGILSRIKIMARLNIAEQRLPQDGRIKVPVRGKEIDLRVSTVPTLYGESVVLRILDRQEVRLDFAALGFSEHAIGGIRRLINQPNGIVLVTGPTGSGKTTTLYAALSELNRGDSKLFTVEDPVEYHFDGINQTHVRPQIGLDFATVLRSILRQDPDIIMVGEIRDRETASVAVQASLTGHLVLSTLHTNSAAAAISRLLDMGVEDYLLVSTLRGVLAQRLVRKLCPHCREPSLAGTSATENLRLPGTPASPLEQALTYEAKGCSRCHGVGFSGRTVIYELLPVDSRIRNLVLERSPDSDIGEAARAGGMVTLSECGIAKAALGETTMAEVARVTASL
jgi:general secretion pathway protein E